MEGGGLGQRRELPSAAGGSESSPPPVLPPPPPGPRSLSPYPALLFAPTLQPLVIHPHIEEKKGVRSKRKGADPEEGRQGGGRDPSPAPPGSLPRCKTIVVRCVGEHRGLNPGPLAP
jgi:hypothetical protein